MYQSLHTFFLLSTLLPYNIRYVWVFLSLFSLSREPTYVHSSLPHLLDFHISSYTQKEEISKEKQQKKKKKKWRKNCSGKSKVENEQEEAKKKWKWMSVKMDINFLLAMCFDSKFISQTRKSVTESIFSLLRLLFFLPC